VKVDRIIFKVKERLLRKEYREVRNVGLFDDNWYLNTYPDVKESEQDALVHYIMYGEKEGRLPSPYFDINYLKGQIGHSIGSKNYFAYFCTCETAKKLSCNYYFDVNFYLENNPDLHGFNGSPFEHYLHQGIFEGRLPSAKPDAMSYFNQDNIVSHQQKHMETGNKSSIGPSSFERDFRDKGSSYEEPVLNPALTYSPKVKALAYYLPQFHPIEENDLWWGKGFTEWRNVVRGVSRFNGHYQPHLPSYLGYYDLRVKEVMSDQIELAKAAGLHGFCFYHYWFNGKRILEKPVNMFLDNRDLEFPFCIMWANENWTRTWDGLENDVLMSQDYREEDDIAFIKDLGRHFADDRYIRINGRPLFFIYRPGIIPNTNKTIKRWRLLCQEYLNEEPLFFMAQAFGDNEPTKLGLDGAIEFPPHKIAVGLPDSSRLAGDVDANFEGHYPSYDSLVESSLNSEVSKDFPLIRGVTPSWDNEARKPNKGMGFTNSTPQKYEEWLRKVNSYALSNPIADGESFVVINAWNEWAEGAHLEPDIYWGASYLNATRRAMFNVDDMNGKLKLLLVGHDAHSHGAQLLTLNIFRTLKESFGIDTVCILLDGGELVNDYKKIGPTYVANGSLDYFENLIRDINGNGDFKNAICNTVVTGACTEVLVKKGFKVISLIHELETLINENSLQDKALKISENADKIVFASKFVNDSFESVVNGLGDKAVIKPQGIYQSLKRSDTSRQALREILHLEEDSKIIVNAGFADLRKGFDFFINIAREMSSLVENVHFVWLGNVESSMKHWVLKDIENTKLAEHIHIQPFTKDISTYLEGADVFALTSREDPFPSVVLESLALGTPVVGFEGGGGFTDVLSDEINGVLVPMGDCREFAKALLNVIQRDNESLKKQRVEFSLKSFDWNDYVFSLVELLYPDVKRISVVIPNYNYDKYIQERLASVFEQHYPVYEVIVLDDKSDDNSIDVITAEAEFKGRSIKLVVNDENSGSVFKQWKLGATIAKGSYLWIAEADDLASPNYLSEMICGDSDFVMAYVDSKQIDENGKSLADDYRYYYDDQIIAKLDSPAIYDGHKILKDCLSVKNQFMNVSACLFDTISIREVLEEGISQLAKFTVAGDWYVYVNMLSKPNVSCKIIGGSLNIHRRHSNSVTKSNYNVQYDEIKFIQEYCAGIVDANIEEQQNYLAEVKKILQA
jgi:glycosyltransferase involved in cell wall biosynthesis